MPNLDPNLAAEFTALERLRLAVLQYRDEVIDLRKSRGLTALSDIPRLEVEIPEEFQALLEAVKVSSAVVVPAPVVPAPVPAPVVSVPVVAAPVPAPVFVAPVPAPPPVIPAPAPVAPVVAREAGPATEPAETPADTFDERVRTAPFAPITSPSQVYLPSRADAKEAPARTEPGILTRAEGLASRPAVPEITEIKASTATPVPLAPRAEARLSDNTRTPTPVLSPAIPNRRPGMSQSIQAETVGSFLRRFRLANE
jgi:hypothetical protein